MSNTDMPVICSMQCLVNWGPKSNHFFIKKNCLKQLIPKMIFYWKKNRKQIKSANSFCLWTLNCTSISRTCFFFKMDCFCFTGITLSLVLLFLSLYHGHFLGATTIRTAVAASACRNLWGAIELGDGLFSVYTLWQGGPHNPARDLTCI